MRFHVLTVFPRMFDSPFAEGIVNRARDRGLIDIKLYDIRDYTHDKHRSVDDYPFGGGPGMLMKIEPVYETLESVKGTASLSQGTPVVLLSPQGRMLTQRVVEEYSQYQDLVLICGRYEGFDERIHQYLATDEISIGDYVLSGGELAAMVMIESIARLVPGVVGSIESAEDDTFTTGLLKGPEYTRPAEFHGWSVPEILMSGNHAEIARWRRQESLHRTFSRRPDLLPEAELAGDDLEFLESLRLLNDTTDNALHKDGD